MLHENTIKNQEKITSFEQLKVGLRSLIATDDLEPEQARLLFNAYGDKLKNDDPELYSKLSDIVSKHLKAHEPELYAKRIELDRKEAQQ